MYPMVWPTVNITGLYRSVSVTPVSCRCQFIALVLIYEATNELSFIYIEDQISLTAGRLQTANMKTYLFGKGKKVEKEGFAMEGPGYKNHADTNADHIFA